ncbi:YraN family protein [uncultured Microbacterium sp.]|uniref:YraN family protein n=1 Tax=uncultured Microbacterium sp. TaxID=191216 RepID=UPI0025D4B271|nr:YraN family protein [uncultured Microbacterium sp.]
MTTKDDLGRAGEDRAATHLRALGYRILDRNWRCDQGELDIVAQAPGVLAFVEVKTRSTLDYGHPFEAIDERKRARLWRLALAWVREHPSHGGGVVLRLEAIGIVGANPATGTLEHLRDLR